MNDRNYINDSRVIAGENEEPRLDEVKMTMTFVLEIHGIEEEVEFPFQWKVCDLCDGKGTHVNPSIDAGGLSQDDFDEDPEFKEEYFSGAYDVPCNKCKGRTTFPEIDEEACDEVQKIELEAYHKQQEEEAQFEAESRAERSMGA